MAGNMLMINVGVNSKNAENSLASLEETLKNISKKDSDLKVGELVQIKSWDMLRKEFETDNFGNIQTHHPFSKKLKHFCGKFGEILSIDDDLVTLKLFNCEYCKESFECSIEILKKVK